MKPSVLIIDDEPVFSASAAGALRSEGFNSHSVGSFERARESLASTKPDVLLMERRLPDGDGVEFLQALQASSLRGHHAISVLIVTAHGDLQNAVEVMQAGASDYLTKPIAMPHLVERVRKIFEERQRHHDTVLDRNTIRLPRVTAISTAKRAIAERLSSVATSSFTPVLFLGPSGAGKRYHAEMLHSLTYPDREQAPFVEFNCAGTPAETAEGELFGSDSLGAQDSLLARRSSIEIADGGTLFLDDIAAMHLGLQSKLLRFLDHMRFRRLGSPKERSAAVRVVAAASNDIATMVRKGQFREDLYHRLSTFRVVVPPLAEGVEDIEPLAKAYLQYFAGLLKKRVVGMQDGALRALLAYRYPGNVRELRNIIERAVILSSNSQLTNDDLVLPDHSAVRGERDSFFHIDLDKDAKPLPLEHVERQYVARVLTHYKGHRTAAAEILGISYPTFLKRLRELGFREEHVS